jgi:predicted ester cyclase
MDHAVTARRMYDLISSGDIDGFGEVLADDFVEHEETPGLAPTKDGVLEFFRMQRAGFPDLRMDPEDVVVSGDKVVTRGKLTGTHQGELMGMRATGKSIDVQLIDISRFGGDGLAHEHWGVVDMMAMMQQLGVVPVGEVSTRRMLLAEGSYAEGGVSDAIPCGTPEVGRWASASGDSERCLVDVSEAGLQLARR